MKLILFIILCVNIIFFCSCRKENDEPPDDESQLEVLFHDTTYIEVDPYEWLPYSAGDTLAYFSQDHGLIKYTTKDSIKIVKSTEYNTNGKQISYFHVERVFIEFRPIDEKFYGFHFSYCLASRPNIVGEIIHHNCMNLRADYEHTSFASFYVPYTDSTFVGWNWYNYYDSITLQVETFYKVYHFYQDPIYWNKEKGIVAFGYEGSLYVLYGH